MCDRIDALRYLITNKFGSKKELKAKINEHYEVFVTIGYLYEPPMSPEKLRSEKESVHEHPFVREWIATEEAYRRAKVLNIKVNKGCLLNATKVRRSFRRRYLLSSILRRRADAESADSMKSEKSEKPEISGYYEYSFNHR